MSALARTAVLLTLGLLAASGCKSDRTTGDYPGTENTSLRVEPSSETVSSGQTVVFTATSPWGSDVLWSVLPESCGAFAEGGAFTALATPPATCTILAMLRADARYTAAAQVMVLPAAPPQPSSPDLAQTSGSLQATDDGALGNAALVGELTPAMESTDDGGDTTVRHGFTPTGSPSQP